MIKHYTINGASVSREEIQRLISENPELLEKETKPWRAEKDGKYWYVTDGGVVTYDSDDKYPSDDYRYRYLTGNYFATKEEAEAHKARLEAIGRVTHAILEANEGWEPNWSYENEAKYYTYYSHPWNGFDWSQVNSLQDVQILPFAKSREIVETIISEYEDDLRIIFKLD